MTANEVADVLESCFTKADWIVIEAAAQLRFQQKEINALREQVQYLQTQVYGGTTK